MLRAARAGVESVRVAVRDTGTNAAKMPIEEERIEEDSGCEQSQRFFPSPRRFSAPFSRRFTTVFTVIFFPCRIK